MRFCSSSAQGLKVGDMVVLKHPYGIGPRDEEYTDSVRAHPTGSTTSRDPLMSLCVPLQTGVLRRFSFVRYQDVAAVVED